MSAIASGLCVLSLCALGLLHATGLASASLPTQTFAYLNISGFAFWLGLVYSTYTVCRHGLPIHNTTVLTHPGPETKVNPIGILIGFLVVYGMSV